MSIPYPLPIGYFKKTFWYYYIAKKTQSKYYDSYK